MRDIRPNSRKKEPIRPIEPLPDEAELRSFRKKPVKPAKPRFTGKQVPLSKIDTRDRVQDESGEGSRDLFVKKRRSMGPVKLGHKERMIVGILILLATATALLGGLMFLPSANIRMALKTAPLLVDESMIIQSGKTVKGEVPGRVIMKNVEVQGTSEVTSTEVDGRKANGKVRLVNKTFAEQQIKGGSRLVTKDGMLFYIGEKGAVIPAAEGATLGYATVEVEAAEAGAEFNIKAQRLDFAALDESSRSLVYAEVAEAFDNGAGNVVSVVKEEDIQAAKKKASKLARQQLEKEAAEKLEDGWSLMEESWTYDLAEFQSDRNPGDREPTINFTAKGNIYVMAYDTGSLEDLLKSELEERLSEDYMLFPGPISYSKEVRGSDWKNGKIEVAVRVTHTTMPRMSIETLRQKLAGRSVEEAQEYVKGLAGVRSVNVELWPFWVRSIPRIEKRINLDLQPERQP